jgi:hypothetical protein
MFDSKEYSFADISVLVGGVDVARLQEVSYKESQTKETVYGKGAMPVAIQRGQKTYEGQLVILQSEFLALKKAAGGSILNLHCDITITYGNALNGDVLTTDILQGCEFTEAELKLSQEDTYMKISLPFIFLRKK